MLGVRLGPEKRQDKHLKQSSNTVDWCVARVWPGYMVMPVKRFMLV